VTRPADAVVTPLEPGQSPGFLLWHATLRWQRSVAAALRPLDLTHVQFVLLACAWWLNREGQHPNQVGVARAAGTEIKMTSEVLRSLERKGLIEREVDPADTRAKRLRVTERGAELAPRAIAEVEAVDAEFFKPLGKKAVGVLERLAGPPPASRQR
jgi:DNA-binding MarR family transcriptional regulator